MSDHALVRVTVISGDRVWVAWRVRYRPPGDVQRTARWREFYLLPDNDHEVAPSERSISLAIDVHERYLRGTT